MKFIYIYSILIFLFIHCSLLDKEEDNGNSPSVQLSKQDQSKVLLIGKIKIPETSLDELPEFKGKQSMNIIDYDEELSGNNSNIIDYDEEIQPDTIIDYDEDITPSDVIDYDEDLENHITANKNILLFTLSKEGTVDKILGAAKSDKKGYFLFKVTKSLYENYLLGVGLGTKDNFLLYRIISKTQQNILNIQSDISFRIMNRLVIPYKNSQFGEFSSGNRNKLFVLSDFFEGATPENNFSGEKKFLLAMKKESVNEMFENKNSLQLLNKIKEQTRLKNNQITYLVKNDVLFSDKQGNLTPPEGSDTSTSEQCEPDLCSCIVKNKFDAAVLKEDPSFNHSINLDEPLVINKPVKLHSIGNQPYGDISLLFNEPEDSKNTISKGFSTEGTEDDKIWSWNYETVFKTPGFKCVGFVAHSNDSKEKDNPPRGPLYLVYKLIYVGEKEGDKAPDCLKSIPKRPIISARQPFNGQTPYDNIPVENLSCY